MLNLMDVSKKYKNFYALKQINLKIEKGKLYLFIGENGSGKSTTIKLISKVIFANSGRINNEFSKVIYLPDQCNYPKLLTVKSYLSLYLPNKNKEIDEKMKEYHLENKLIGGLSKGMQQKLGILQLLLCDADLYLFDEPQDGLDKVSCKMFKDDIDKLVKNGKTIIISTHMRTLFKDLQPEIIKFKGGIVCEK